MYRLASRVIRFAGFLFTLMMSLGISSRITTSMN
jgi:hypothetical protein